MAINKWVIIILIVLILASMGTVAVIKFSDKDIKDALAAVKNKYGSQIARTIERMYRLETNHFKSGGFKNTFSPGMEKHSEIFPYGWTSMQNIWSDESLRPIGFWTAKEGQGISNDGGHVKTFLKFGSIKAAMFTLAEYLVKYRAGRWYSTQPAMQAKYEASLLNIKPRFVNDLV